MSATFQSALDRLDMALAHVDVLLRSDPSPVVDTKSEETLRREIADLKKQLAQADARAKKANAQINKALHQIEKVISPLSPSQSAPASNESF